MARVFISHSSRDKAVAAQILEWLRSRGFDNAFLDFDKHAGIPPGADWERTLYREIERSQAVIVLLTRSWLDSKWCFAEFTQARALGKAIFPVIEAPSGEQLIGQDLQHIDLTTDREQGLARLERALTDLALQTPEAFELPKGIPPYPGLNAFDEKHAAVFFGRDDAIARLVETLRRRRTRGGARLVVVLGASGSGKSSLLRAGLLPRLKRDRDNWITLPAFRPEFDPVGRFIDTLLLPLRAAKTPADVLARWEAELASETPDTALAAVARALRQTHEALDAVVLIPVDQGEELFTTSPRDQTQRFFALLSRVLQEDLPFVALMTLRSDYLGALQTTGDLSVSFEPSPLEPMPLERIGAIVRGPARIAHLDVDDTLVTALTRDAKSADALPLVAFSLRELYERFGRGGGALTLGDYERLGDRAAGLNPLEHAIRQAAEDALPRAGRSLEDDTTLREAFVPALVRVNEDGEFVRRPARMSEIPVQARPQIAKLVEARLLVQRVEADSGSPAAEPIVEVAHEALLRVWPRLAGWLTEEHDFLVGKSRLEQAVADYRSLAPEVRDKGLLTGILLERARDWLVDHPTRFSPEERDFVRASAQRAQADERRRVALRRTVTWGSIAAAVVFAVIAGLAYLQFREARQNLTLALNATDSLALDIARELGHSASIATSDKLFLANRLERSFEALLQLAGSSGEFQARYAELLTSNALMLVESGYLDLAAERLRHAEDLLFEDQSIDGNELLRARTKLAVALGHIHAASFSEAHIALDAARAYLDAAPAAVRQSEADQAVLRGQLARIRARLLREELRLDEAAQATAAAQAEISRALEALPETAALRPARRALFKELYEVHVNNSDIYDILKLGDISQIYADFRADLDRGRAAFAPDGEPEWTFFDAYCSIVKGLVQFADDQLEQSLESTDLAVAALTDLVQSDNDNLRWRSALAHLLLERAHYSRLADDHPQASADIAAARAISVSIKRDTGHPYFSSRVDVGADFQEAYLASVTGGKPLQSYSKLIARGSLFKQRFREPNRPNDWTYFGHWGSLTTRLAADNAEGALDSARRALEAIDENEQIIGSNPYTWARRYYIHEQVVAAGRTKIGDAAWQAHFDEAMKQLEAILAVDPNNAAWLSNLAYVLGAKGDYLTSDQDHGTAADYYRRAIDAGLRAFRLNPQLSNTARNVLAQSRFLLKSRLAAGAWPDVLAAARSPHQVLPPDGQPKETLKDFLRYWKSFDENLEAALNQARDQQGAEPELVDGLQREAARSREVMHSIEARIASLDEAPLASHRPLDLRELDLSPISLERTANTMQVSQRVGWSSPPIYPAAWLTLVGDELAAAIQSFGGVGVFGDVGSTKGIVRVRAASLSFYDKGRLLEAEHLDSAGRLITTTILATPGKIYHLNGTSPPIHQANVEVPLHLRNAADTSGYLRFFTSYVRGEAGSFQLVESADALPWSPTASHSVRAAVDRLLRPVVVWSDPDGGQAWRATATVQYSNVIFHALFRIQNTGMVEMLDDQPVAVDLPLDLPKYEAGGRMLGQVKWLNFDLIGAKAIDDEVDALLELARGPKRQRPAHYLALAEEAAAVQLAIAAVADEPSEKTRQVLRRVAALYRDAGEFEAAFGYQERIVAELRARIGDDAETDEIAAESAELADLALLMGDVQRARQLIGEAIASQPDEPHLRLRQAHVELALGNAARAREIYRANAGSSIDGEPWPRAAAAELARIEASGHYADSVKAFREWLDGESKASESSERR